MKTKQMIIIIICIILAAFALGAAGIVNVTNETAKKNLDEDHLIGVLITKEYLDLFDGNINDQGRLYAELVETSQPDETGETIKAKEYVFKDIKGIRFFGPKIPDESGIDGSGSYMSTNIDEGITDASTHFTILDDCETVSLKGTIYVASGGKSGNFYFNPVYQTSKGDVYAMSGEGISFLGEGNGPGTSMSQKISENRTSSDESKISSGTEVEVTVSVMEDPTRIALLQFDSKNELLEKADFTPGNLPESIDVLPDAQYMIVETTSAEGIHRTLFQQEDDFIYVFTSRDDGICIKQTYEVNWND